MSLLIYALVVLIIVGVIAAVSNYIPFPPPVAWLRWVIPVLALLFGVILIAQKAGVA